MAVNAVSNMATGGTLSKSSFPRTQSGYINQIFRTAAQNNAVSAREAADLRDWQVAQNKLAMDFNMQEAAKNRNWQEYMSNTAHQREVRDLKAAGLNPILSAMGGNGAAVTSGATASGVTSSGAKGDVDTSGNSALVALLGTILSNQVQLENKRVDAQTNLAVADKYNAMSKYTSELASQTQLTSANISAMASKLVSENSLKAAQTSASATRYASDNSLKAAQTSAAATRYASDNARDASKYQADISRLNSLISYNASKYGTDVGAMTQKEIAAFNASINKELKKMDIDANFDLHKWFPSNPIQYVGATIQHISDLFR